MKKKNVDKLLFGGLVVLIGVLYLLFNIGTLPLVWKPIILSWQMLFIVIGVIGLLHRHYWGGSFFTAVGIVFILPRLCPALGYSCPAALFNASVWPVIVILLGIWMITYPIRRHYMMHRFMHCNYDHYNENMFNYNHRHNSYKQNENGKIYYNLLMSGVDEVFLGHEFHGGKIKTVMAGVKFDLRKATLPEGETVLKIETILGGVELRIPEDWHVEVRSESTFGDFVDKRPSNGQYVDRKLIIIANSILGGGDIRC